MNNKWTYIKANELLHESGFRLELLSGTWLAPSELNPITIKEHSPVTTAGFIREGLKFAKRHTPPKTTQRTNPYSSLGHKFKSLII